MICVRYGRLDTVPKKFLIDVVCYLPESWGECAM